MRKLLWMCGILLCSIAGIAQTRTVTGRVTDQSGTGIPFATIIQTGTSNGTQADSSGFFRIDLPVGASLTVTAAGFQDQTLRVTGNTVSFSTAILVRCRCRKWWLPHSA
jgi:hypothetical protein